ncbi:hypothetical protein HQQ81_01035 [Microbacteriaceae bacterium VKM Ac-2854]|nr:hypothetical protein [Microbacteriaceae bacterium VKM Ac-2854]
MMLIENEPGRWVARDTAMAPARGFVTLVGPSQYHAESYHIVREKREDLGDHATAEAALAAIVSFTATQSRAPGTR